MDGGVEDELPVGTIDAYWLQRELGKFFNDPMVAQKAAEDVLETLVEAPLPVKKAAGRWSGYCSGSGSGSRLRLAARARGPTLARPGAALARPWRGPWCPVGGRPACSAWHAPPLLRAAPPGVLHASGGVELNPEPLTLTLTRRRSATARTSWWCCSTMTSSTLSSCCSSTAGRWPRARSSRRLRAPATGRRCYASQRDESGPSVYGAAAQRTASPRTDRLVLGGAPRTLTRRARARADRRVKAGGCRATATAAACQCSRGSH
jgi:hypothetical protein